MSSTRNDAEIEKDVLGTLVRFPERLHDSGVSDRHFFQAMHKDCLKLFRERGCSASSVNEAFLGSLEDVEDICERSCTDASLKQQLDHLARLAEIREAGKAANRLCDALKEVDPADARPEIEKATSELAKATSGGGRKLVNAKNASKELASKTGERIDIFLDGLYVRRSEVIFLAAEPKTGKTTFATQLVRDFVDRYDGLNLMFSMEMTAKEIFEKDIQRLHGSRIWQTRLDGSENPLYTTYTHKVDEWYASPERSGELVLACQGSATVQQIKSTALQAQGESGKRLRSIVIDQFDKLKPERFTDNDSSNSKSITVALNELAKELGVPVFVLIQVNARKNKKADDRFTKDDVFGTSGPEQDAGQLWIMQRVPGSSWTADGILPIEISVAAGRSGGTGGVIDACHIGPSSTIKAGGI